MWRLLGRTDPMPSAMQARIAGSKGVWYISAPTDSTNAVHQEKWIEIKKSQLKFRPHDEDLEDARFESQRLSFELLKYSKPLSSSTLNLAFIPVLRDRGVAMQKITEQILVYLDFERKDLLDALDDPPSIRTWIHNHNALLEDSERENEMAWLGALPFTLVEKIIFLIEVCLSFLFAGASGF